MEIRYVFSELYSLIRSLSCRLQAETVSEHKDKGKV